MLVYSVSVILLVRNERRLFRFFIVDGAEWEIQKDIYVIVFMLGGVVFREA